MTNIQFITTPDGAKMAVLPVKDLERLQNAAENAADVYAYDEALRRLDAGEDEMIPSEMVDRMLDGESSVRVWREHRGLKAKDLAAKAGISAAYLSEIEHGKKEPTVKSLRAIADALGVDLDDLA